jgi:hypothetical protein
VTRTCRNCRVRVTAPFQALTGTGARPALNGAVT